MRYSMGSAQYIVENLSSFLPKWALGLSHVEVFAHLSPTYGSPFTSESPTLLGRGCRQVIWAEW